MVSEAWHEIDDEHYQKFWRLFDDRFAFRPGIAPGRWPAIQEPAPSVTIDLAPVFASPPAEFAAAADAVNTLALLAMVRLLSPDDRLLVLDWQHPSYWFWPHRQATAADPWQVEVFPNGDYYMFLTEDMTTGTFGHPWEQTLCVFGEPFVRTLAPMLSSWLPIKRENR